jgi:hypothetical protein
LHCSPNITTMIKTRSSEMILKEKKIKWRKKFNSVICCNTNSLDSNVMIYTYCMSINIRLSHDRGHTTQHVADD